MDFRGKTRTNTHWQAIYPSQHHTDPARSRSVTLISAAIATDAWSEIPFPSPDVTGVELRGDFGTIRLINAYNDCEHNDTLDIIAAYLADPQTRVSAGPGPLSYLLVGDFNRHHPMWDEDRNAHLFTPAALALTSPLLDLIARHDLSMALPKDIPTLCASNGGNLTRIDNVFCSASLVNRIVECDTHPEFTPVKADHFPIITIIDVEVDASELEPKPNFRMTDWDNFGKELEQGLEGLVMGEVTTVEEFDERLRALEEVVARTVAKLVPMMRLSPYTKRWWTTDLGVQKKAMRHKARRSYQFSSDANHPAHEEYRQIRNAYSEAIRVAKVEHWVGWLEGLDETSVWDASRLAMGPASDGGRTRVPTLRVLHPVTKEVMRVATTNEEKSALLFDTFFPEKPAQGEDVQETLYPAPAWTFANITDDQIHRAIRKMKPYKATRTGTTPNCVMVYNRDLLVPHLAPLFRATNTLRHYPADWAVTQTLVLRKPGKADYTLPGAWRPIVLSNGFARLLNSCLTEDIVSHCETLGLLPNNHFGARPGRTTTDSLHLLVRTIKDAWRRRQVVSVLFLDVKGAFPSVSVERLLDDMRWLGVPQEITEWLRRRLAQRTTTLHFDGFCSAIFGVDNGLDQGDPVSVICYVIYNAGLLGIPLRRRRETMLLFVDDVALAVSGADFAETHARLKEVMEDDGGIFEWARLHNCSFGVEKFQLLDAASRWRGLQPSLVLGAQTVVPTRTATFLGVIIDDGLRWKAQGVAALRKGQAWVGQLSRLAQVTKGVSRNHMRRLYLAIAVPRMLYAADVFLTQTTRRQAAPTAQRGNSGLINKLATVQRNAALAITGGMRTTATDTLDVLANLLPFHILVEQHRMQAALRLAALPESHPLYHAVATSARRFVKRFPTPLHFLMSQLRELRVRPEKLERIAAVRQANKWVADLRITIASTKEEAVAADEEETSALVVYSDGSGLEGRIGAAAVLFRDGVERRQAGMCLGSVRRHTVYEGECVGAVLGLELLRRERTITNATICIDSQPAIRAAVSNRPVPGHYIFDAFHRNLAILRQRHPAMQLCIRWVPGHVDVAGNEAADEAARAAATKERRTKRRHLPALLQKSLPHSKAAARQRYRGKLAQKGRSVWGRSPRNGSLSRLAPSLLRPSFLREIGKLPRKHTSLVTQLMTGHIPLAGHLHRIGKADSPSCPCCHRAYETVAHYILHCPVHHLERSVMFSGLRISSRNLTSLLATTANRVRLLNFVASTGRLRSVFGVVAPLVTTEEAAHA